MRMAGELISIFEILQNESKNPAQALLQQQPIPWGMIWYQNNPTTISGVGLLFFTKRGTKKDQKRHPDPFA